MAGTDDLNSEDATKLFKELWQEELKNGRKPMEHNVIQRMMLHNDLNIKLRFKK